MADTMRAWRVHELGHPSVAMHLEDVDQPQPGVGQLRIRVEAVNVNFADILLCQGVYQDRPGVPFTPGLEAVGIVDAAGPGTPFDVGTRLAGMAALPAGAYAEQALLRVATALAVPDDVDPADATVLFSTYQTAHVGLVHRALLQPDEWLLVHGAASGVGAAAVQLGAALGARVIATAGSARKLAHCRSIGAIEALNHNDEDVYAEVMRITGGRGVDVAYDPVGGSLGDVTRRLMAWEGRLLVIGFASGEIPSYPANHVLVKNYSVIGLHWGANPEHGRRDVLEKTHADLIARYRAGTVRPDISARYGLQDVPAALAALESRDVLGRLAIVF